MPDDYTKKPPQIKFDHKLYHLNVNQKTAEMKFHELQKINWKESTRLFQIIMLILKRLKSAEKK